MEPESTRRNFLRGSSVTAAGLLTAEGHAIGREQHAEHEQHADGHAEPSDYSRDRPSAGGALGSPTDRGKLVPGVRAAGQKPVPVIVPDLSERLAGTVVDGVREFHLHCTPVKREFLPGLFMDVWGFNGTMPGPTIEAVQGDRVRLVVHNELPESTAVHWHGLEMPVQFDGVPGLTQPPIRPGESYTYEFALHQSGTFFYHSHDAMQEGLGMVGLFIVHPRVPYEPPVDRDFALLSQEWAVLPGATIPNTMSMEFNLFTFNGRSGPYVTPLVCKLGERVRIRLVNFSAIDHHPFHVHGMTFWVTATEGGRIPPSAWVPGNTVLVGVAQVREIEFIANNVGDWPLHCHMFHHMMNFMSSTVGPMGGHTVRGMRAGQNPSGGMGIATGGAALSSEAFGPSMGRSMGEQTGTDRTVGNMAGMPMQPGHGHGMGGAGAGRPVPGFPAGMLDMPVLWTEEQIRKLNKRETRGMRADWYTGVEGLFTVVRVLPPALYDSVMSGEGEVVPGSSIPGADIRPGAPGGHRHQG
jgi:FtsP/CotA-like multicopper oxidase with cupredoxin domain